MRIGTVVKALQQIAERDFPRFGSLHVHAEAGALGVVVDARGACTVRFFESGTVTDCELGEEIAVVAVGGARA